MSYQPIPQPVVDAIVAAGLDLRAESCDPVSYRTIGWTWSRAGLSPIRWHVKVGAFDTYRGAYGYGAGELPRAALLDALASLAGYHDRAESMSRSESKRLRAERRKVLAKEAADESAKEAADVRALAANVADLWPKVTP